MGLAARPAVLLTALCCAGLAHAGACRVASGPQRAALVELYTSEGCSSCPPADRQLSQLGARDGESAGKTPVVPLALHVGFWDYLGWKDPYARPEFVARQRALIAANGSRTVYTPHFFVNGEEVRDRSGLRAAIARQASQPPDAAIAIEAKHSGSGLEIAVRAKSGSATRTGSPLTLQVAVTESGLANGVRAGENRGATLHHDHVVRAWLAPAAFAAAETSLSRTIDLTPEQREKGVAVVAFVQAGSGAVLQAASTGICKAP